MNRPQHKRAAGFSLRGRPQEKGSSPFVKPRELKARGSVRGRPQSSVLSPQSFAFTLVELLVVIGIIGIIIALLLPSLGAVGNAAKRAKTFARFNAIDAGLLTYRNATGESYPPSNSDKLDNIGEIGRPDCEVLSPFVNNDQIIEITGANLLVWALAGADLLGTPAFVDVDRDGEWWNDTHRIHEGDFGRLADGLYALSDDSRRQPLRRRYDHFIDMTKAEIVTLQDLAEDVLLPRNRPDLSIPLSPGSSNTSLYLRQLVMLDGFGYPILYYKANVGASEMVSYEDSSDSTWKTGVYNQNDNRLYTGDGPEGDGYVGMDLGAGRNHELDHIENGVSPDPGEDNLNNASFDGTFAKFIWNRQVAEVRNVPVKKDSYLLISPGPDALWGTDDDITNFNN